MLRAKSFRSVSTALALVLMVAACSQQTEKKESEAPATPEATAPATPEAAPPATPAATTPAAPPAGAMLLEVRDAAGAQLSGDAAKGERIYRQCQTCHVTDAGVNKVGPSLHGIIGRKAGTVPNFRYSNANRISGITWTEQELFNYLENPRARVPGTIMAFVGLRSPQDRADVIAYLKTQSQ